VIHIDDATPAVTTDGSIPKIGLRPLVSDECDYVVMTFEFPPHYAGVVHWHPEDTIYFVRRGEFIVDGEAQLSCLVPACQADGSKVATVEAADLTPIQDAFLEEGGAQCGICTPGMIVMTRAHLDRCAKDGVAVTMESAREALAGNLCRCTGYEKILASVLRAAREESAR
jgi:aerobic-type carbon monoxide dehydrogenase small subunit (CoxS/CutS family)